MWNFVLAAASATVTVVIKPILVPIKKANVKANDATQTQCFSRQLIAGKKNHVYPTPPPPHRVMNGPDSSALNFNGIRAASAVRGRAIDGPSGGGLGVEVVASHTSQDREHVYRVVRSVHPPRGSRPRPPPAPNDLMAGCSKLCCTKVGRGSCEERVAITAVLFSSQMFINSVLPRRATPHGT